MGPSDPKRTEQFIELLSSHQRQLLGYIVALVHNMDDAEDLLQQTNMVLWRKFDDYRPGTEFIRWACHVAHLEVLNFLRRSRRSPMPLDERLLLQLADQRLDRSTIYEHYREALRLCMERLTADDRELLALCYGGALSIKDIALRLGRSADSVYHSLRRIRCILMGCITRTTAHEERTL
jgi:RNA polymerase sigma-70 factor, ECF subfamily